MLLKKQAPYLGLVERGPKHIKGKGMMKTYFVKSFNSELSEDLGESGLH